MGHTLAISTYLLLIRGIEWSGEGHGVTSSGHPPGQENSICAVQDIRPLAPLGTHTASLLLPLCGQVRLLESPPLF